MFGIVDGVEDGKNGTARVADCSERSAIGIMIMEVDQPTNVLHSLS